MAVRPTFAVFDYPHSPRPANEPPVGTGWIHEIKHDGSVLVEPTTSLAVM